MTHASPSHSPRIKSGASGPLSLPQGERGFGEAAARLSGAASLVLGWRPDEFWNCTPAELALAMTVGPAVDGPDAQTIEALQNRFPDGNGGP